jgi:ATP-dependent helicase/nuclease subunit A
MTDTPSVASSLTPQQTAAIETRDVSVALAAGDLGRLVAITFTERAAREMRERIRAACRARLDRCPLAEVDHWLRVVREIDSARVSTIHAFCSSLLRSYAVEARLDPRFGLLDPATSGIFLRNSVTETIHRLLVARHPDCLEFVLEYGLNRTLAVCELLVTQRFRIDFARWSTVTPSDLEQVWKQRFAQTTVPQLLRNVSDSRMARKLIALLKQYVPDHAVMRERCAAVLADLPRLATARDPQLAIAALREQAQVKGGGSKKVWPSEEVYEAVKNGLAKLRELLDKTRDNLEFVEDDLPIAAEWSLRTLHIAQQAIADYQLRKTETGQLDFDDLLLMTRDLLVQNRQVCRRAAAGIDFLMVDEFQDTDPMQADIVRALCGERLLRGKLFLVGDAQQSIYRFRRADPAVFHGLRSEIPERGRLPLSMNFRSQPAILHFANALFAEPLGNDYQPLVPHATKQLSPAPSIEFLFAVPETTDDAGERESAGQRRHREAEWIARRLHQLLHDGVPRIRERDPQTGEMGLRPARPGDVVILFRALSDIRYYEAALRECQLDYYLVGGRAFYSQQEVFDLVNLFQHLGDVDDEVSLVGVLRSPFFSLSDDTLYALVRSAGSLGAALELPPPSELDPEQASLVVHAGSVLRELRQQKDRLPLTALLNLVLERTGYDAALLPEFLGRRKLANLRKLIEIAREFDRSGLYTLADFVAQLRTAVGEQTDEELAATHPESSDVIRLMSIHQSKGLEFPIVVLADMDRSGPPQSLLAYFHADLGPLVALAKHHGHDTEHLGMRIHKFQENQADQAETVRLLYVAVTRAADHLILSGSLKGANQVSSPWMQLLGDQFDLETGQLRLDPDTGEPVIPPPYCQTCPEILAHRAAPPRPQLARQASASLSWKEFRAAVETSLPSPLPETLRPIVGGVSAHRQFSLSELEACDAELQTALEGLRGNSRTAEGDGLPVLGGPDAELLGTLVHAALERVDFGNPKDPERLIAECWDVFPGGLPEKVRATAAALLARVLASPVREELAAARQCYRELDFQLRWPLQDASASHALIVGKIDCLFEAADGKWVLWDYKTGRLSPSADSQSSAQYDLQLGVYALAIREMLGRLPERIELIPLREPERRLAFAPSPKRLDELACRVTQAVQNLTR